MENKEKICVVGYKTGVNERGYVHGHIFSELNECCDEFRRWFHSTGNHKVPTFNKSHAPHDDEKNGVNFVTRGGELQIELRLSESENDSCPKVNQVRFCPFCGAKIEIKETRTVRLVPKYRSVFDGYQEQSKGGE